MEKDVNKLLVRWLKKNNKAKLTWLLGYDNTSVIDRWVDRKKVPWFQVERLLKIIEEGIENESELSSPRGNVYRNERTSRDAC